MSGYRTLPSIGSDDPRAIALAVRQIAAGKINSTGTVTLAASTTTTQVNDERAGGDSVILLMPRTANAATAISSTYVSARTKQSFTLTHANNAQTDRTFGYVVLG